MKTPYVIAQKDKGQVLVFGAIIFLIVLIPLAALVIDGSVVMLNRRQAQAAADAGALAGAKELCKRNPDQATATAQDYVERNNATFLGATVSYDVSTLLGEITVSTSVSRPSFFAKLIGYPTLSSNASATAGCFIPTKLSRLLPLSWSCPDLQPDPNGGLLCNGVPTIPWEDISNPPPNTLSVFTDSGTGQGAYDPAIICAGETVLDSQGVLVTGTMKCTNIPGIGQVFGGGARSWLNLTGDSSAPGTAFLENWLQNGYPGYVEIGQILTGQPGAQGPIYDAVPDTNDKPWVLPIVEQYPADQDKTWIVRGFSWLYITCVNRSNLPQKYDPKTWNVTKYNQCPGGQAWLEANKENVGSMPSGNTIEGYFVSDYHPVEDPSGNGTFDYGVYYVSLIK